MWPGMPGPRGSSRVCEPWGAAASLFNRQLVPSLCLSFSTCIMGTDGTPGRVCRPGTVHTASDSLPGPSPQSPRPPPAAFNHSCQARPRGEPHERAEAGGTQRASGALGFCAADGIARVFGSCDPGTALPFSICPSRNKSCFRYADSPDDGTATPRGAVTGAAGAQAVRRQRGQCPCYRRETAVRRAREAPVCRWERPPPPPHPSALCRVLAS